MQTLVSLLLVFAVWGGRSALAAEDWASVEKIILSEDGATGKARTDPWSTYIPQGEFLIDTAITYVGAPDAQDFPSVAFDGANYLVVWSDHRNGIDSDIYGTRVSTQGVILDRGGIPISTAPEDQEVPSIVFDGTSYLVAWHDRRNGSDWEIYGSRVSTDGTVLDLTGIPIFAARDDQEHPSVAFDGTNYLVVWQDRRVGCDIYGARVDRDGTVLDPMGIPISTATNFQLSPSIAFDGVNYFVVWHDYRSGVDIYGSRVSSAGVVLDPLGIPISAAPDDQREPSIAFDGINCLVVWHDYRRGNDWDIYGTRVNRDGLVLDTAGIRVSAPGLERYPSLAFDGTNYLVVWQDKQNGDYDIRGVRVDRDGSVLDWAPLRISDAANHQSHPSVAFDGVNYLAAWCDWRAGEDLDIYSSRITQHGKILDRAGIQVSTAAYPQYSPSVAFDGTNYLIIWEDGRNWPDLFDIYGARVDQSGTVLDPSGIEISVETDWQRAPSVALDGTDYLVVWEDLRSGTDFDVYGTRIGQSGLVLDTVGIPISVAEASQEHPSVAYDGTNYFVVWQDGRSGYPYAYLIYGTRVSRDGVVLDTSGIRILRGAYYQLDPSVAFNGAHYLVVWVVSRWPDHQIIGARVDPSGVTLDTVEIVISSAPNDQMHPSVASDGTDYLVVWQDYRNGSDWDIYGARVNQEGVVLDPWGIPISRAACDQEEPSVIFSDPDYVVVWQDRRNGADYDLYGARVSSSGSVMDSFAVCTQAGNQVSPSVVKGVGSQHLIANRGWAPHPWDTPRIWGKFSTFVGIEEGETGIRRHASGISLLQNYPNPFSRATTIPYSLPPRRGDAGTRGGGDVSTYQRINLSIYDVAGRLVRTLVDDQKEAGSYTVRWDSRDDSGVDVAGGVYLYRLDADGFTATKKAIVLK